jgi:hypothetical protein
VSFYHKCIRCGCLFDVRRKGANQWGKIEGPTNRPIYFCPWCGDTHTVGDGCMTRRGQK